MAKHICPVWVGYFLANRLRRILQNPYKILSPYVRPHMIVLDVGSAMGFFSLPMAEMVGPGGQVICVDVQPAMLRALCRRAVAAGLAGRIETHASSEYSIGLDGWNDHFDFALAFSVLHEVPGRGNFLREIHQMLKPGACLLLTEPNKHVSPVEFDRTISNAQAEGFTVTAHPQVHLSYAAILTKLEPTEQ
jgi:2-polyprenyl-3-methyl-5-hydroxy-6-metoxy-1,4-benzoquinol methylase